MEVKEGKDGSEEWTTPMRMSSRASTQEMPAVLNEPAFLCKFRRFNKGEYLGYILNNAVGVLLQSGSHVIGHNKEEFNENEQEETQSDILIDHTETLNLQKVDNKPPVRAGRPRFAMNAKKRTPEESLKSSQFLSREVRSEQVSFKELEDDFKFRGNKGLKKFAAGMLEHQWTDKFKSGVDEKKLGPYWKAL